MASTPKLDEITEAVLRRYYVDDMSKIEIGQQLGLSRFKVARVIQEAKRLGLVRIEITPAASDTELSETLRRALGLRRAVVASGSTADESSLRRVLASLGAQLVTEMAGNRSIVGFASSRSLSEVGEAIQSLHDCTVVQLNGVPSHDDLAEGPVELVRTVAAKTSKSGRIYYAPFIVDDARTAEALRKDPMIRSVVSKYTQLDLAVVTVGAMKPGNSALWEAASESDRAAIVEAGGVGEICGVAFNARGENIQTPLTSRTIAISPSELSHVKEVVAVINSDARAEAVYAAALGKWITCLVTSEGVARDLLRIAENRTDA